ncbi:patatin-like phospholipase family protein [Moorena sp. SIO4G3]|uniref:patatin-like phospholipase family protein n=1 Tax=Moorena sp. SIO4G3 TaxID=2607821 RepID=UPI00142B8BDD|nr:patatin-like phospholipase family protein [Moorena sp. SIO4G3]NEO77263.1 patatin-like phospholipase family protein [Moorena sp. SIO4G3]
MVNSKEEKPKFKILSLDGGGMRGVISARILQEIEDKIDKKYGQKLHEYFDLVAGTSTGSILAAGIACKMDAGKLIEVYEKQGENIFLKSIRDMRKWRKLSQIFGGGVLYPHEFPDKSGEQGLANVLKGKLKINSDKKSNKCPLLSEIKDLQLLIPSYDILSRNTTWFANDDPKEWFYNLPLWQICTASASAPTFFPPYQLQYSDQKSLPHIDGGVSANNPVLAAIAYALSMTSDKKPSNIGKIAVLSIGTGKTTYPYTYAEVKKWGEAQWARHIPHMFLDPDAENSEQIALRMFRGIGRQNYLRLNFDVNKHSNKKEIYNEYIRKSNTLKDKNDKRKEHVCEDIDNPDAFEELKFAAECYLKYGKVDYKKDNDSPDIPVEDAIDNFIYNHPPDHKH